MKGKPVEYQDSGSSISELTDNFSSYTSFSCVQQKQVLVYFNHISRVFWSLQPKSFLYLERCRKLGVEPNLTNLQKSRKWNFKEGVRTDNTNDAELSKGKWD